MSGELRRELCKAMHKAFYSDGSRPIDPPSAWGEEADAAIAVFERFVEKERDDIIRSVPPGVALNLDQAAQVTFCSRLLTDLAALRAPQAEKRCPQCCGPLTPKGNCARTVEILKDCGQPTPPPAGECECKEGPDIPQSRLPCRRCGRPARGEKGDGK